MTQKPWKNRIRVRSCGILVEDNKLLLVELFSPVTESWIWMPPGGEVHFGETLEHAVAREFKEETGLEVSVEDQLFTNQVIQSSIHAVEVYFRVNREGGQIALGNDPELDADDQILRNIGFFTKDVIQTKHLAPSFLQDKLEELLR